MEADLDLIKAFLGAILAAVTFMVCRQDLRLSRVQSWLMAIIVVGLITLMERIFY